MSKKLLLAVLVTYSLALTSLTYAAQGLTPKSENEKTRLSKEEITTLMINTARLPIKEQESRMDLIWTGKADSKTPRSDFLFCTGLAYTGNYKAQVYLGRAYENGTGIVEDHLEAYLWYSIALDNSIDEKEIAKEIQADRDRVKTNLLSFYPAPSEEELDDSVKEQKQRMVEYQAEIRNTKL